MSDYKHNRLYNITMVLMWISVALSLTSVILNIRSYKKNCDARDDYAQAAIHLHETRAALERASTSEGQPAWDQDNGSTW